MTKTKTKTSERPDNNQQGIATLSVTELQNVKGGALNAYLRLKGTR